MSKFDPEIAAALEGYVEEGEDEVELEDDFVQLAGGEKSEEEDEGEGKFYFIINDFCNLLFRLVEIHRA
jgi:hypothetical protein